MHLNDSGFTVEGSGADGNETTVAFTNPTADRTITLPNATGNLAVFTTAPTAAISDGSSGQFLKTDGSGALSFATAASGADLYAANESSPAAQPSATGANAVAIGDSAVAEGGYAFAAGLGASASGNYSVALGRIASSTQNYATAIGNNSDANGSSSISIGLNTTAGSTYSTAFGAGNSGVGAVTAGLGAMALGGSYASGADSLAAAIANNTSSYGATGAYSVAIGRQVKATANTASSLGGYLNVASDAYSTTLGGYGNQASGDYATVAGGYFNVASGVGSFAHGLRASATQYGKKAYASGYFAATGDAQGGKFILRSDTTDATAEALTTNNSTANATNQIVAASDTCITFHGTITAM